tara:strand:- start:1762 stop:1980 length:219 start_codon:yes stop_codon:yes gene_type:complete
MSDKKRILQCLKASNVMHFKDNFIEGKNYEVVDGGGGAPCVKSEKGTFYPVHASLDELIDVDLSFEFKPLFI